MASKAEYLLILNTLFFVLTWVSVSLRIYVRTKIIRTWGLDDWLILSSQLIFTILFALNLVQINYGAGKHISDISVAHYRKALLVLSHNEMTTDIHQTIGKANVSIQYWWLCDISYTICCSMLKLSIGGSVATVIRTFYIHTLNDPDFEWATAELTILSNIEVGVGITATCLATLRPLLRIVSDRYKGYQSSHTNRDELNTGGSRPLWPSCIMEAETDSSRAHSLSKIRKVAFLPPQYRVKNINSRKAIGQGRYQKNNALAYDAAYFGMV
ncbi:hypothetical protein BDV33DRAFT_184582 [Aspergillus novoparasiticus]|uniref:Rhodopsin domain-containing protein n=1 Tax=Aspergillus novoparasiticus TaxID=986946 RepID=A0A5N6E8A2_9EURO|nr:hypothetical protein BDV33DRAFT_184582 [Aspergillus novoparasiticus]